MRRIVMIMLLLLFALVLGAGTQNETSGQDPVLDEKIKGIIKERVDKCNKNFGIVVGIVNEKGSTVFGYGKLSKDSNQEVDGNTVFELGSVTKTFTAILLADMVERGILNLDDPIEKFLPKSVTVPTRNNKKISLFHLATHTSGLPGTPDNSGSKDEKPGYVGYTEEQLYKFLSGYTLPRDIGSEFEYSNMGMGLLGHLLSFKGGASYDDLVLKRILEPLEMKHTRRTLSPAMKGHMTVGYYLDGQESRHWPMPPVFAGAGGLRSTAADMLKFLAANMGLDKSPLLPAIQKTHIGQKSIKGEAFKVGLAWLIIHEDDVNIILHEGGTGANRSFIGFDPKKRTGVVVLSNSNSILTDIGLYALTGKGEILTLGDYKTPESVQVDPAVYNDYVGKYQTTPTFFITVTTENGRLFAQGTGQPKFELFPETETRFFLKAVRATVTFVKDSEGKVIKAIIHSSEGEEVSEKIK